MITGRAHRSIEYKDPIVREIRGIKHNLSIERLHADASGREGTRNMTRVLYCITKENTLFQFPMVPWKNNNTTGGTTPCVVGPRRYAYVRS